MQQFNPIDAAMLFLETPETPFHVNMVNVYDPSTCPGKAPTFEDIVESVRVCLPGAPSFRRKIVRVPFDIDYPYWVEDEHFDLEFHMRHLALPKPGDWDQFRSQVSRLISRPLDLTRPPWEIWIIEGLDNMEGLPSGCFAMVLKIHHCAIDGQAGVQLFTMLHQESADRTPEVLEDLWQSEPVPDNKTLLKGAFKSTFRRPAAILKLIMSNARGLLTAAFDEMRSDDEGDEERNVPVTILQGHVTAPRVFDEVICKLDDLKRVRRVVAGATINDVCLTIVAECMRRYLEEKGDLPEDSLVTTVPIATRTPEQAKSGGNQISMTRVALRTDIADPLERLAAITAETQAKKAVQGGVVMSTILDVVYNLPGVLVGVAARAAPMMVANSKPFCNTMVTNVPGPQQPMYFLGAQNVHFTGGPPLMEGGGVMHSVTSFQGRFLFSFMACRDLLPDADFYRDCLDAAIKDVISAADEILAVESVTEAPDKPASTPAPKKAPAKKKAARKRAASKSQSS